MRDLHGEIGFLSEFTLIIAKSGLVAFRKGTKNAFSRQIDIIM